eukprot:GCRY01002706.1.p1 GENE.GCRY01002706.1~~GCRY01002706.1.p1  ORF type:complete len:252 (-),score=25.90 GCRY01002706.1:278-1033(-)
MMKHRKKGTPRYFSWPGQNRFYCKGRIMLGPDKETLCFTYILIAVPSILFGVFTIPYLSEHVSIAVPICFGVFLFSTFLSLFLTSSIDPGIVPREKPVENGPKYTYRSTKEVEVNGVKVTVKYCETCRLFRPPRCSHCSVCDNCVNRFDHHCPWVGTCIGERNYRFFYLFIVSITLLCLSVFAFSIVHLVILSEDEGDGWDAFVTAVQHAPQSLLLSIFTFFISFSLVGLFLFHTFLICTAQTTNESIKVS